VYKRQFLRNELFLVLVVSLVLILACVGYAQQEVKVIRRPVLLPFYIDPAVGKDATNSEIFCSLYDSLVFPNPDGSVKPSLAKSWEISGDGLTYIFELVAGAKFHNGDEVTADDVVFSLERIMTIGEGYGYLFTSNVEEAKALEKYKVQITIKKRFGPFLGMLVRLYILNKNRVMANIQKEGPYGEFGDYGKGWLVTHDAGSGPYKAKEMKMQEYFLMEQFNDYWAGWENKDAPQYVKLIGSTDAVTVKTLMSRGELELTNQYQMAENLAIINQAPNTEMCSFFESTIQFIILNNRRPPTDDIHFRKALAYSIDYQQLIDQIYPGAYITPIVSANTPGYNTNLKLPEMDLAKAEEELKQSPYYGKLDQYPFELHWNSNNAPKGRLALIVQANAARVGIKVNIVKLTWLSMVANAAKIETTPTGAIISTRGDYPEMGSILDLMYRSRTNGYGTYEQGAWINDPEIDAMLDDAISTIDQKERFQKYYVLQEKIAGLSPNIGLADYATSQVYRSDYVVFPAAEDVKQGKPCSPVKGYNFYFRDFQVFPEKAQKPYTPFKP